MIKKTIPAERQAHIGYILEANPRLFYDETLFRLTCIEIGQGSEADFWSRRFGPNTTMDEMLNALPDDITEHFLKLYDIRFKRTFRK